MTAQPVPDDPTVGLDPVETTVLADCIEDRFAREYALDRLDGAAFTATVTRAVWDRLVALHEHGQPVIPEAFGLSRDGYARATRRAVGLADTAAVDALRERVWRRSVAAAARALADDALNWEVAPDRIARWTVEDVAAGSPFRPDPLPTLDGLADRWGNAPYDWIIPRVLERGDRLVLVAREGHGKTFLCRQWAYQAACGVNWTYPTERCDPIRVLLIDAENSERQTGRAARRLQACARAVTAATGGYDAPKVLIEHALDLNRPVWRDRIEGHLDVERPDLVVIGPLYKVFSFRSKLGYEENATQAATLIDDWRRRYGFAVVVEAHAAKGEDDAAMDPRGSGVWRGWPEFGKQMVHVPDREAWRFGSFRGDRDIRDWPEWWYHNEDQGGWPWVPCREETPPGAGRRAVAAVEHIQTAWDARADLTDEPLSEEPF